MKRAASLLALLGAIAGSARAQQPPKKPAPQSTAPAPAPAAAPSEGRLSDDAELRRVIGLYDAGKYEECAHELDALLDPKGSRPIQRKETKETARIYHAACLIGSGQFERADKPFEDALDENPLMPQPDSLIFPKPVVERFLIVQRNKIEQIRKKQQEQFDQARRAAALAKADEQAREERLRQLEILAGREVVITQNRRWIAALPFGVGQFQNGDRSLGYLFLGSEVLTLGTALTSLAVVTQIQAQAIERENAKQEVDSDAVEARIESWQLAGTIGSWAFLALAAVGIAEAQISFVPEKREVRRRPLPPRAPVKARARELSLAPAVAGGPGGVTLGLQGQF